MDIHYLTAANGPFTVSAGISPIVVSAAEMGRGETSTNVLEIDLVELQPLNNRDSLP